MAHEPRAANARQRQRFVANPDVLAELKMTVADLDDPDARSSVIRNEHPDLDEALREGRNEVKVAGEPINARLHLAMHGIVATQLWEDDPPEVWETARRLLDAGYERDEILHMLAAPVVEQVWGAMHDERPYDRERHVAALKALPGSWEQQRARRGVARRHADAREEARRVARTARRRSRRPR